MMVGDLTAAELARAVGYPYAAPAGSFVVDAHTGAVERLAPGDVPARARDRHAVLAVGSNGAPEQLVRKFGAAPGERRIAVLAATVLGHDVVYAARVARYGAIPATLAPSPGTAAAVKLTMLTDDQLTRMNATEGLGRSYALDRIDPGAVDVGGAAMAAPIRVRHYAAVPGPLAVGGAPVALSAVAATGRRWPARSESEVLEVVAASLGTDVAGFVRRVVRDRAFRNEVNTALAGGLVAPRRLSASPDAGAGSPVRQHGRL
ncbi:MAG TPA: hypothetical protein VFZ79_03025 [Acidimicrobiales bacterium]